MKIYNYNTVIFFIFEFMLIIIQQCRSRKVPFTTIRTSSYCTSSLWNNHNRIAFLTTSAATTSISSRRQHRIMSSYTITSRTTTNLYAKQYRQERDEFYSLNDIKKTDRKYPPMLDSQYVDDESFGAYSYEGRQDDNDNDNNEVKTTPLPQDINTMPSSSKNKQKMTKVMPTKVIATTVIETIQSNTINEKQLIEPPSNESIFSFLDSKSLSVSTEVEKRSDIVDLPNSNDSSVNNIKSYNNNYNESIENLEQKLKDLTQQIYQLNNGNEININSSKQISQILFNGDIQSTARDVLEELSSKGNQIASCILQYRMIKNQMNYKIKKQDSITKGTYVQNAMSVIKPKKHNIAVDILSTSSSSTSDDIFDIVEVNDDKQTLDTDESSEKTMITIMEETLSDPVILLDASSYIFRAYYTMPPIHRSSDGMPTGAVMGFCKMMNSMLLDNMIANEYYNKLPPRVILCFDAKGKNFRHDMYQEYKANRPPAPIDLIPQFDLVREAAKAYGICRIEAPYYEADDVIATLSHIACYKEGIDTNIISGDKDLMQLITKPNGDNDVDIDGSSIQMIDPVKKDRTTFQQVYEKWLVPPDKLGDVLALAGDTVDNVPGVPGIGPKIAAELINEYGTLDNLLNNLDNIKQKKRRETLQTHIEQAKLSRQLVELNTNVPFDSMFINNAKQQQIDNKDFLVSNLRMEPINTKRLFAFYDDMGFKELRRNLEYKIQQQQQQKGGDNNNKLKRQPASTWNKRAKATIPLPEDFSNVPF